MGNPVALRRSLQKTVSETKKWFRASSTRKVRHDWAGRNKLDDGKGEVVYAFFDKKGKALYIGQTKAKLKTRANYPTYKFANKKWWRVWRTLRFLHVSNVTDRLTLELLLILVCQPKYNVKPRKRKIQKMFIEPNRK